MTFVKFDRRNKLHTSGGGECLICNKKMKNGAVVLDPVGPLTYCVRCIRRLVGAADATETT